MAEYLGESRIDGFPIVKIDFKETKRFLNHFKKLNVAVSQVTQLDEPTVFDVLKIHMSAGDLQTELLNYERVEKLKEINGKANT